MKRRFRYYIRHGWHIVDVPEVGGDTHYMTQNNPNMMQYVDMRTWCHSNVAKGEWDGTLHAGSGTPNPNHKRFAFKNAEDKLMFTLRWASGD